MIRELSVPLHSIFWPGFAYAVTAVLYICVPVSVGIVLAWIAWRGFREHASTVARLGRFMAWTVVVLHVGVLLLAVGGVVLVYARSP
jgi:hypothetical protein